MGYLPKSAQRRNAAAQRMIQQIRQANGTTQEPVLRIPRRMELGVTAPGICGLFDVYLNGVKQHLCMVADVDRGYVVRYKQGTGNKATTKVTEHVKGKVEIRRKGEVHRQAEKDVASSAGVACDRSEGADSGVGTGATCSAPAGEGEAS